VHAKFVGSWHGTDPQLFCGPIAKQAAPAKSFPLKRIVEAERFFASQNIHFGVFPPSLKISLTGCKAAWYKELHEISRRSSGVEQLIRNRLAALFISGG
jgi:hypothetical protein